MFIERAYERRHLIPQENESCFKPKQNLNTIEHIGLEAIATEFIIQYEIENFGEVSNGRREDLRQYMRWNENSVDILDGYYNTYEFDGYLFGEVWMTENGIPMLTAHKIPEGCENWEDADFVGDFTAVYFRLD